LKVIFSEKCLEYGGSWHPESPDRVRLVYEFLLRKGFEFIEPEPCSDGDILLVHEESYVNTVKSGSLTDPDTPNIPGIYDYAKLSAGGAIKAMNLAVEGENSFSLMRPPGHHAGRWGAALGAPTLGFCYFNNIAVASSKALTLGLARKIAILDIDCHHGNGTQEIFLGDPRVLFVSLHKYGYFYPGTGGSSEKNCLNYPLGWDTNEEKYLATLRSAISKIKSFDPDLIAVSAGFDTYKYDPIGGLGLSIRAFKSIGKMIRLVGKPTFIVLEGGYSREMPNCVYNLLLGLGE